jgi:O-antigen ligase
MIGVRKRLTEILLLGALVLASLAIGRAVVETQTIDADVRVMVGAAAGIGAALAVVLAGPVACIAAIAALTVLRLLPTVPVGGGVDVFAADLFFAALVGWWLIDTAGLSNHRADLRVRAPLRGWPVLVFLGFAGLTLLYVSAIDPDRLPISLVSWLRIVQTACLGWLAAYFLRTSRDVTVVLSALAAAAAIAVALAVAGAAGQADAGPLGLRGGGLVNPNELGLLSGLLILMASFGALGPSLLHRAPLGLVGVVGLLQSQSVGSLVATSVATLLGLAFLVAPHRRVLAAGALRAAMVLGIAILVAYGLAALIRPSNLPTSEGFGASSAGHRTVMAAAGLELAERNPVIGVGWRRSEDPEVIGDPDVNGELRARFPATRNEYFPDVTPASVHNAYIQVLADLGAIGFALFVLMLVSLGLGVRRVVQLAARGTQEHRQLWFLAWGLVLILVWLNDNPLFGGQSETVASALFLGAIAGLGSALTGAERRSWPRS